MPDGHARFDANIREALTITAEHLGLELGIVSRIEGRRYVVEHAVSPEDALKPGTEFDLGETYCAITMAGDHLVTIDEMGRSEYKGHPCYALFKLESYIGAPFRVNGEVYGTVNFSSAMRRDGDYGRPERGLLQLMSTWVEHAYEGRRAEQQLLQSERLATVGSLAAGVAHELNNPLAYVVANLDVVSEELLDIMGGSPSRRLRELYDAAAEARQGAERARRIVRTLRTFSRVEAEERGPQTVSRLVDIAIAMTRNELRHRARLVRDYQATPVVEVDESRLTQVFVNLLMNAAQAINPGRADEHEVRVTSRTDKQGWAVVEVADSGAGIPNDVLGRIFDPFFTTKPVGEGTGLGLSLSQQMVTEHGGTLEAGPSPSGGALFTVRLPPFQGDVAEPVESTPIQRDVARGRVLVIDDDELVARSIRRVIGSRHVVVLASDGQTGLELLEEAGGDFDVILCDMMMPAMQGWEVYERMVEDFPAAAERVIFVTGGTLGQHARAFLDRVPHPRLEKPFEMQNLRALVDARVQTQGRE